MEIHVFIDFITHKKTPYLVKWVPATRTRKAAIKYKVLQNADVLNLDNWTQKTITAEQYPQSLQVQLNIALHLSGLHGHVTSLTNGLNKTRNV